MPASECAGGGGNGGVGGRRPVPLDVTNVRFKSGHRVSAPPTRRARNDPSSHFVGRGAPRDGARAAMLSTVARRAARSAPAARRGFAADASGGAPAGAGSTAAGALRTVVAVGIAGATAMVVEDALNDLALWRICKNHAVPVIETHPRLLRSLGAPFRSEAWWNSSVTSKARGNLASCVFLVDGSRASCDVQVVMMRVRVGAQPHPQPRHAHLVAHRAHGGHPSPRARGGSPRSRQPPAGTGAQGRRARETIHIQSARSRMARMVRTGKGEAPRGTQREERRAHRGGRRGCVAREIVSTRRVSYRTLR